jgi:hypothetical protein
VAEAYDAAIRRRLEQINGWGDSAGQFASQRAQAIAQQRAAQQAQYSYGGEPTAQGLSGTAPGGNFGSFLRAIAGKESGGNYRARNADSGALGKYQIMPGNIGPWSQDILGRRISPQQFYSSPRLQEQIAQGMLRRYYTQYGPEGAAVAWYAGPGTAKKYMRQRGRGYNAAQGKYPSISAYALSILRKMGLR